MSDWVCGRCKSINRERSATCYSCGGMRGAVQLSLNPGAAAPGGGTPVAGGGTAVAATAGAFGGEAGGIMPVAEVAMPEAVPVLPAGPVNLVGGVLGGAVGAVIATAVWYGTVAVTNWQIGFVAIAVGFVVGQGVAVGATNRASILLVPISLAFTLVALVVSEYLIVRHFLVAEGFGIDLVQPPDVVFEVVRMSLETDPMTLLFWAIAGWEAFIIPFRAATRPAA